MTTKTPELTALLRSKSWRVHHIGHAVESIEKHLDFYTKILGFELEGREMLPAHQVEVIFFKFDNGLMELISPLPGNTTLRSFLDKRGEGLHHICFEVASVNDELRRLESEGIRLIDQTARPGFGDSEIAFIHPSSTGGILLELCSFPSAS